MIWTIFSRILKDRKWTILIYGLAAILFLWMYIALFPYVQSQAEQFSKLIEAYPKAMMEAMDLEMSQLSFTKLESFLAMEYFSFIWPIMAIALAVSLAGAIVSGEVEKGTIELLLSQPISRVKLFFAKYLTSLVILIIFTLVSIFAVIPLAEAYNIEYFLKNYFTAGILSFLFGLAVLSISALMSSIFSEKGRVYFASVGILILMYVLNIIANLKENLSDLKYASFFHYFDTSKALVENNIDGLSIWVFVGVSVVFTILAAIWFSKRDITI